MIAGQKIAAIIPARMGSSRFPGKPLVKILGLAMIEHVRRRALRMDFIDEVIVATCDQEIQTLVESHGGRVIMTSNTHERCTDRIEEAARQLSAEIIVNIQGDEPMVAEDAIRRVIEPFENAKSLNCSCVIYPITEDLEFHSVNIVKTVLSLEKKILYFSRPPSLQIPGALEQRFLSNQGLWPFEKNSCINFQPCTKARLSNLNR